MQNEALYRRQRKMTELRSMRQVWNTSYYMKASTLKGQGRSVYCSKPITEIEKKIKTCTKRANPHLNKSSMQAQADGAFEK